MVIEAEATARLAACALEENQAVNVQQYDVRGRSDITDFVLIASGTAAPHLKALAREIQETLKQSGEATFRVSGDPDSGWIVLDCIDVVIHIFDAPTRDYYAIEELLRAEPPEEPPES